LLKLETPLRFKENKTLYAKPGKKRKSIQEKPKTPKKKPKPPKDPVTLDELDAAGRNKKIGVKKRSLKQE